ncbi:hypothetical protein [Gemmiger formicilis]|nr:hypothetical protein [Gemmiger formicilis]
MPRRTAHGKASHSTQKKTGRATARMRRPNDAKADRRDTTAGRLPRAPRQAKDKPQTQRTKSTPTRLKSTKITKTTARSRAAGTENTPTPPAKNQPGASRQQSITPANNAPRAVQHAKHPAPTTPTLRQSAVETARKNDPQHSTRKPRQPHTRRARPHTAPTEDGQTAEQDQEPRAEQHSQRRTARTTQLKNNPDEPTLGTAHRATNRPNNTEENHAALTGHSLERQNSQPTAAASHSANQSGQLNRRAHSRHSEADAKRAPHIPTNHTTPATRALRTPHSPMKPDTRADATAAIGKARRARTAASPATNGTRARGPGTPERPHTQDHGTSHAETSKTTHTTQNVSPPKNKTWLQNTAFTPAGRPDPHMAKTTHKRPSKMERTQPPTTEKLTPAPQTRRKKPEPS